MFLVTDLQFDSINKRTETHQGSSTPVAALQDYIKTNILYFKYNYKMSRVFFVDISALVVWGNVSSIVKCWKLIQGNNDLNDWSR